MTKSKNKWSMFATSIFSHMSQLAQAEGAINLGQGFPDFDGPQKIKEAANAAILTGKNQYAPAIGIAPLRKLLSEQMLARSGLTFDPNTEVTVFSGATEALFCSLMALCDQGDEVICFAPHYDSYRAPLVAVNGKLITYDLHGDGWGFDRDKLESLVTPRTKALLLNTPHNPSGKVFCRAEISAICEIVKKHELTLICDEVYEHLVFGDNTHLFAAAFDDMRKRTITISSTSKTFSMTGWKVGYAFAPADLSLLIRNVHQFTVFCSATPLQWGMVAALELGQDYYEDFRKDYKRRKVLMGEVLKEAGFKVFDPQGTYFMVADYSKFSGENDILFAERLCREAKVAAIPLSPFYDLKSPMQQQSRFLRFAFCKSEESIVAAGPHLKGLLNRLGGI